MTLKTRRRYHPRAPYAICTDRKCDWTDSGTGGGLHSRLAIAEAEVHHEQTGGDNGGHLVRVDWHQTLLIGQPYTLASPPPRCVHDRFEDAPHGVIGCCAEGAE